MTSLDDLSGTVGNWAGVAVGTGVAVMGANAVFGQLNKLGNAKPRRRRKSKAKYKRAPFYDNGYAY